ncbi:EamA family transporter [Aphanothece hegewaldii CCALA 016]|uniref:EamA family transporter n=1 Tax=Aphanothece hegewaldii CCALA 016 TaxID=2107694 RepID=A0A2T1LS25_9CHRO|nr:DMT family transporter [Aphanothece hegewaldii]PSF32240.1 EamA family transporter [Aphanothece hegewaldii CCALA 016]
MLTKISQFLSHIPSLVYLWVAVLIFAASNSVTRKIIELGEHHLVNGRNPISLCNVLFVGNICAFLVMISIFYSEWKPRKLKNLTRGDWISLTIIGSLSGAIAPALIFTALDQTNVTNVVLIGRLEPPLTLALSVWLLGVRVNFWTVVSSLMTLVGVLTTAFLGSSGQAIATMGGLHLGKGELEIALAAIILSVATVISKSRLKSIPIGIFSIYRTVIGTVIFFILANALYGSHHFSDAFSPYLWAWMFLYATVIVVVGQLCWFAGLRNATSKDTTLASSFNPIAAIFMAYLILGEMPSPAQYLGGSIILAGIFLSLIGNFTYTKNKNLSSRSSLINAMEMAIGFRGI